jgi:ribosomal protein S18 acetylase RimI-like enzyme
MWESQELFDRSEATLVACWAYLASVSPGARVADRDGAAIAVFTSGAESKIYNNSILRGSVTDPVATIAGIEHVYADAGVARFATWVHESNAAFGDVLRSVGYEADESNQVMGLGLDELVDIDTSVLEFAEPEIDEFLRINGLPSMFPDLGPDVHIYVCTADGRNAATLMTYDHDGDCGVFNVATLEFARRRGLGRRLTTYALQRARERGCRTASLQSTEIGRSVYAAVGFRSLGAYTEFVRPAP